MRKCCYCYYYYLILILIVLNQYYSLDYTKSIDEIIINEYGITITSFHYNPKSNPSQWINRIIGHQSTYMTRSDWFEQTSEEDITFNEWETSTNQIKSTISIPNYSFWPKCSYEMLGFVMLDHTPPFDREYRYNGPIIGNGFVYNHLTNYSSICYYRALFENWRHEGLKSKPNHWVVVFYCPIHSTNECKQLNEYHKDINNHAIPITLSMNVTSIIWNTTFTTRFYHPERIKPIELRRNSFKLGICLVLPYISSDNTKHVINNAILTNWIKYYTKLGFYLFIYDRNGNHNHVIKNLNSNHNIIYNNYTIRSLLTTEQMLVYDNTERLRALNKSDLTNSIRHEKQGHDKVHTLTQCRFDARTSYNMKNIFVIDFDEFIYCPVVSNTSYDQSNYLHNMLSTYSNRGIEQLIFYQRIVANRTISIKECIYNNIKNQMNIFHCFSSYKYIISGHSIKSFYLDYTCPLTGYHQSCATTSPRGYDCHCDSQLIVNECSLLHISTNHEHYSHPIVSYSNDEYHDMNYIDLEIIDILK